MDTIATNSHALAVNQCFPLLENIDKAVNLVSQHLAPHTIQVAHSPKRAMMQLDGVLLDQVAILDIQYGADVNIYPAHCDRFLISMSLTGVSEKRHGMVRSFHTQDNIIISNPNSLSHVFMDSEGHDISVTVSQRAIEAYLSNILGFEIQEPLVFETIVDSRGEIGAVWVGMLQNILSQTRIAPTLLNNRRIIDQYATSVMEILLSLFKHNYSEQLNGDKKVPTPWHVRQAKDYIEAHLSEPITMAGLAAEVGVSARTLQNGFRNFESTTPADYIRERRLQRLHQSLLQADPAERIIDLMFLHGITSFGRFAQYYQKRFGCLPSDTLKKGIA